MRVVPIRERVTSQPEAWSVERSPAVSTAPKNGIPPVGLSHQSETSLIYHGKAGVVRRVDGTASAFLGSVNESASAWRVNYELLWEDNDPETIAWVQEEFDALWNDARAVDLACCPFIAQDVERIIARRVVEPEEWKTNFDPTTAAATAAVESPVYRREQGLWPHQKYFARLALERHRLGGARLVLADQVGLGKTIQLAMAALLMALDDPAGGPILVLAPKPLLQQWQDELMELLSLPSARWNGRAWVDENDLEYPSEGVKSLGKCPRRIGLLNLGFHDCSLPGRGLTGECLKVCFVMANGFSRMGRGEAIRWRGNVCREGSSRFHSGSG